MQFNKDKSTFLDLGRSRQMHELRTGNSCGFGFFWGVGLFFLSQVCNRLEAGHAMLCCCSNIINQQSQSARLALWMEHCHLQSNLVSLQYRSTVVHFEYGLILCLTWLDYILKVQRRGARIHCCSVEVALPGLGKGR